MFAEISQLQTEKFPGPHSLDSGKTKNQGAPVSAALLVRGEICPRKHLLFRGAAHIGTDKPNLGLIDTAPSPIANRKRGSDVSPSRIAVLGFPGTPDGRQGRAQLLRNFPQTHPLCPKFHSLRPVGHHPRPANRATRLRPTEPGMCNSRLHPFTQDAPFQLRHRRDDREHHLAHWGRGVQRLLVGNEVDS